MNFTSYMTNISVDICIRLLNADSSDHLIIESMIKSSRFSPSTKNSMRYICGNVNRFVNTEAYRQTEKAKRFLDTI